MVRASWSESLRELRRDGDRFVADPSPARGGRLFGGLVMAQALAAACETVGEPFLPQSLHAYFVRGGVPDTPIDFDVVRVREGRAFATRRVTASQAGKAILEMMGSFHVPEPGEDWHPPAPRRPSVETSPPSDRNAPGSVVERRSAGESSFGPPFWVRVTEPVGDDPVTRACVLTYLSDMGLMAAARPHGLTVSGDQPQARPRQARDAASLDHALWFHRPFDPNAWHCYEADKVNSSDSRGLARGGFYDEQGSLIASTAQEALWRV